MYRCVEFDLQRLKARSLLLKTSMWSSQKPKAVRVVACARQMLTDIVHRSMFVILQVSMVCAVPFPKLYKLHLSILGNFRKQLPAAWSIAGETFVWAFLWLRL